MKDCHTKEAGIRSLQDKMDSPYCADAMGDIPWIGALSHFPYDVFSLPVYFAIFLSSQPGLQFCIVLVAELLCANDREFRVLDIDQKRAGGECNRQEGHEHSHS